ncbi:MAG TPA: lactonase family protein, partial [Terriglobia bacterium]|nr:lactonase family protein [Terriglobia bacterium]
IDARTGSLTLLNKVSGGGGGTTHLAFDRTAHILVAANFAGQVTTFHLNPDGTLGERVARIQHASPVPDPPFPNRPHPHGVTIAPDNRYLFVPDTGLNKVFSYKFDSKSGALASNAPPSMDLPAGYGPRRMAFRPDGRFAYLIEENDSSVTAFAYEKTRGELKLLQTISTLPTEFKGDKSAAELWIDRTGRFLYAASRSDNTIVVFSIAARNGTLSLLQRVPTEGKSPRHLVADSAGRYLFVANSMSNNVAIFRIDANDGHLSPTGQELAVPEPTCVQFVVSE